MEKNQRFVEEKRKPALSVTAGRLLRSTTSQSRAAAVTAPLVGEPLAKDAFFAMIAYGSKTNICRKAKADGSRAKSSEAHTLENVTVCQGLPY